MGFEFNPADEDVHRECREEIRRLKSIVDRLPVTKDGVPVIPGLDYVWHWEDVMREFNPLYGRRIIVATRGGKGRKAMGPFEAVPDPTIVFSDYFRRSPSECYSTRELALEEQARQYKMITKSS